MLLAWILLACSTTPEPPTPRQALEIAVADCKANADCLASLQADADLLGSCPWYEAIGCSAAVAAAVTCCAATEGELCLECVELVAEIGCCDCLPKGKVRDSCKKL